jgi:Na+/H+ antiporter NhaD/arsenite permease-like protein
MELAIVAVFVLGYAFIALEHSVRIDKAASALLTGTLCWALFVLGSDGPPAHLAAEFAHAGEGGLKAFFEHRLLHHVQEIASILFFLLGAMTIVELVDAHEGFSAITDRIRTKNTVQLLWIVSFITFFLSSVLDNLTTAIVMVSLLRKLIADKETRWFFAGMVVLAANAGGAWSPIGDVTTTMLWIGGQVTTEGIISALFLPSLVVLLLPLFVLSFRLKGEIQRPESAQGGHGTGVLTRERNLALILGVGGLLFVPVFKTVTHLPPFMGMMLALGVMWVVTERMHRNKDTSAGQGVSVLAVLRKIDTPSILFFLGILLAVAALQEVGHLLAAATWLRDTFGNVYAINTAIGFLSAIVDNVPLVAASKAMYPIATNAMAAGSAWDALFVQDGDFWELQALCAGTGGSILIIGSAAGVAVMGLEKIDFVWYLRRVSLLAALGYLGGIACYWLMFA